MAVWPARTSSRWIPGGAPKAPHLSTGGNTPGTRSRIPFPGLEGATPASASVRSESSSLRDAPMVAVGFNPRFYAPTVCVASRRPSATTCPRLNRRYATKSHAVPLPWIEIHGYQQHLATRGTAQPQRNHPSVSSVAMISRPIQASEMRAPPSRRTLLSDIGVDELKVGAARGERPGSPQSGRRGCNNLARDKTPRTATSPPRIPTGFGPPAQGCEERATLGFETEPRLGS